MLSMYLTVRIIISVIFALIIMIIMLKRKKFNLLNFLGIVAVFFAITALIPAENVFLSFESPVVAMKYMESETVTDEIEAEDFAVLVYRKSVNALDVFVTQKGSSGYKIPFVFNKHKENVELPYEYPNLSVKLCKSTSSDKALLVIIEYDALLEDNRYEYTDSQGNEFKQLDNQTVGEENETIAAIYYAEISLADDYSFSINNGNVQNEITVK